MAEQVNRYDMHSAQSLRRELEQLSDLPNIGKAIAADLNLLGIYKPADLIGQDPYALYERLCGLTACRQDPCVLDIFLAITDFMSGADAQPWWHYTAGRKRKLENKKI